MDTEVVSGKRPRISLKEVVVFGEEPLPQKVPTQTEEMVELLELLKVGGSLDVPKNKDSARWMVGTYRRTRGGTFVIRDLRPGWTRIWRVK